MQNAISPFYCFEKIKRLTAKQVQKDTCSYWQVSLGGNGVYHVLHSSPSIGHVGRIRNNRANMAVSQADLWQYMHINQLLFI